MARAQIKYTVTDERGNVIQNAKVFVYETGTTTPLTDLFAAFSGGVADADSALISNDQGQIEGYVDTPRKVKLTVTDNSGAAYHPWNPAVTLTFTAFSEDPVPAYEDPNEEETDDAAFAAHLVDTTDAHDASAISVVDAGGFYAGTDLEAVTQEIGTTLALKAPLASPTFTGTVTFADGVNLVVGSGSGTKIGTATTQKLGFFNATPVVQPAGSSDVLGSLVTLGLRGASANPPLNLGAGSITAGSSTFSGLVTISSGGLSVVAGGIDIGDGGTVSVGAATGTKIGANTGQKLGFFGATPVVQPAGSSDVLGSLVTLGLRGASANPPLNLGSGAITSGAVTASGTVTAPDLAVNDAAGQNRDVSFNTAGSSRWIVRVDSSAEGGADAGSDFQIVSRTDAGALKAVVMAITRSSSLVTWSDGVNFAVGSTLGTQLGTAPTQKLAFFGATPVVQIGGGVDVLAGLVSLGLRAASANPPLNLGTGAVTAGGTSSFATATFSGTAQSDFFTNVGNTGSFLNFTGGSAIVTQRIAAAAALVAKGAAGQTTSLFEARDSGDVVQFAVGQQGNLTLIDGAAIVVGSTNGTKIGTATTQKLGFYNATPVVQPTGSSDVLASLVTLGLRAASANPPLNLGTGAITSGSIAATGSFQLTDTDGTGGFVASSVGLSGQNFINYRAAGAAAGVAPTIKALNSAGTVAIAGIAFVLDDQTGGSEDGSMAFVVRTAGAVRTPLWVDGSTFNWRDGSDHVFGTATGSKLGTATTQKLAFYGATPVVQQAGIADADGTLADITTKFNSLLAKLEAYGLLAVA